MAKADPGPATKDQKTPLKPKIPLWRKLIYALVTVLLLLGIGEGTLWVLGYEGTTLAELQAQAGFSHGAYVWRRDRILGDWYLEESGPHGGSWMVSNRQLQARGFHQERFPVTPPAGELRIFAMGGSTTYGIPFEHQEHGFPERLQTVLQKRHPAVRWRLINAGVAGMDSRAFPAMARQIVGLTHGLIIYSGNNELRGTLIEACSDPYREGLERWLNQVRMVRMVRNSYRELRKDEPMPINEMAAHQDKCSTHEVNRQISLARNGEDISARRGDDEPWFPVAPARTDRFYLEAVRVFRKNLEQVLALARGRGVKVYLVFPAVNYLHAPNLSLPRPGLPRQDQDRLEQLVRSGEAFLDQKRLEEARRDLDAALALDPSHAQANYLAGRLDLQQGLVQRARKRLQLAVDNDYFGDRITSHMEGVLRQLCKTRKELTCADAKAAFARASPRGIPRKDLFVDFCHPTFKKGVQLIARSLAAVIRPSQLR